MALALAVRLVGLLALVAGAAVAGRDVHARLTRWDADWYARIAAHGYGAVVHHPDGRLLSDYAFFPLYPLTERLVHAVLPLGFADAGLLVSWASDSFIPLGLQLVASARVSRALGFLR